MKVNEKKIDYSTALEELENDNLTSNIYDLFDAVNVQTETDKPKSTFITERETNFWDQYLDKIEQWLFNYKELNKPDRLSMSDISITSCKTNLISGVLLIVNGLNGSTHVSRQSLKHVMDIITYLEDYYGARAWISSTWYHSDVFYYTISFVIWKDHLENNEYGNLKPLRHND